MKRYLILALVLLALCIPSMAFTPVYNASLSTIYATYSSGDEIIDDWGAKWDTYNVTAYCQAQGWSAQAYIGTNYNTYTGKVMNLTGGGITGVNVPHYNLTQQASLEPGQVQYVTLTSAQTSTRTAFSRIVACCRTGSGRTCAPSGYAEIFQPIWYIRDDVTFQTDEVPAPPTVDYTCNVNPIYPYENSPFGLTCTDASTAYPAINARNWTLSQPDGSIYSSTNTSLVKSLTAYGWYGLEYEACNAYGCGYANTSQLVNVTSDLIPETGISFWVHTYDPITGAKIGPSDIGIGNVTSGGWRNSSTNLGTAKFDSTDYARLEKLTVGQNVNLCGEAPGYRETCTNVSIAYDGWEYVLNLVRTDLVPAGNQSTMIVNVINSNTAQTISGVTLTLSNSSVPYSSSKLSDSNGIATFSNIPAAGSYQIAASKTGYVSATKFWPVYPGQVSNAYIGMLPVGVTPVTTGPGGDPIYITPTTTTTYAPGETPDTRTDAEKDEDMMNLLRDQGPMLIQFFIVCFVVYMVMGMAGKGGR